MNERVKVVYSIVLPSHKRIPGGWIGTIIGRWRSSELGRDVVRVVFEADGSEEILLLEDVEPT